MKVRASLKKRTPDCKILSINNVKDNLLLFLQKNNLEYGYKNSWCRFASK